MCQEAMLAFQFAVSQPVFTVTNVYLLIQFFTEISVRINKLQDVQEDLCQQLKSVSEAKLPMGRGTARPGVSISTSE